MKRIFLIITLCICMLMQTPVSVNAKVLPIAGYTAEGIYYEAVTLEMKSYSTYGTAYAISLTEEITYKGMIIPNDTISWTEIINGDTYSGMLYLQYFYHYDNTTVAVYTGTIYAQ